MKLREKKENNEENVSEEKINTKKNTDPVKNEENNQSPKHSKEETTLDNDLDKKGNTKISILEEKIKELTSTLQRLQAEFENYQKRSIKQNEEYKLFSNANLIEELLPVLDSLEQGMNHNKELVLVQEQLYKILNKNGLKKILVKKNDEFDHSTMECLMQEKLVGVGDNKITNVLMNGYTLNNKILRTTKVSVNKKNNLGEKKQEEQETKK